MRPGIDVQTFRQQPFEHTRIRQGDSQMERRRAFARIDRGRVGAGLIEGLQDGDVDMGTRQGGVEDGHGVAGLIGQRHTQAQGAAQHGQMRFRKGAEQRLAQTIHDKTLLQTLGRQPARENIGENA